MILLALLNAYVASFFLAFLYFKSFQFEEAIGNYPDPSLPVAHQLEQALNIIRDNIHLLMEAKIQHQLVEKVKHMSFFMFRSL